ncbi:hypothetical protein HMF8227_02595 [Saliniradius amylolyticus]|uniref:DUF4861 domain-containing protein n=1 Tax=Saliniradius amylolyticus TaxID=2183582 RepID=A0A2S2E7X3_9ALTE|nr:DUF4861 family protein [Saliniradius amylolyticus]AWL13047.1 hypothetical protein HMF8227_02595 [Saliniradius amylolyticus]
MKSSFQTRWTFCAASLLLSAVVTGCQPSVESAPQITISNPSPTERRDEIVRVSVTELGEPGQPLRGAAVVLDNGRKIVPGQWLDEDLDSQPDTLLFSVSLEANGKASYRLREADKISLQTRTYAELGKRYDAQRQDGVYTGGSFKAVEAMTLPEQHEIGDGLFKYEGPGWESDKVAYRLYFDKRNVIDIFGKRQPELTLPQVGNVDAPSYHELQPWGMDILKTGPSIGLGSLAVYQDKRARRIDNSEQMTVSIRHSTPLYSEVEVSHQGFVGETGQADIDARYGIEAGSALTQVTVSAEGELPQWVTGIVKHESQLMQSGDHQAGPWRYIATYGDQSYINDGLGMVVFYRQTDVQTLTQDEHNHLVVMKPSLQTLEYYFGGYWQQGPDAIGSKAQFQDMLEHELIKLNQPLLVQVEH